MPPHEDDITELLLLAIPVARDQGWILQRGAVTLLGFDRRDVANRSHQPAVIKPVDPFERSELHGPRVKVLCG